MTSPRPRRRSGLTASVVLVTASAVLSSAFGIAVSAIIARGVSTADFGRYSYVVWLASVLPTLAGGWVTVTGIKFIAEALGAGSERGAGEVERMVRGVIRLSSAGWTAAFILCAVIVRPRDWHGALAIFVAVVAVSIFAKMRYLLNISVAKGHQYFGAEAYVTTGVGLLNVLATVLLFAAGAGLLGYLALFAAANVAYAAASTLLLRRAGIRPALAVPDQKHRERIRTHMWWSSVLVVVALLGDKSIELFLLNSFADAQSVGFFSIGAALTRGGIDLVTTGLSTVLLPVMAAAYGRDGEHRVMGLLANVLRYFSFAGLLALGVGVLLAPPVISLLYGARYAPAVGACQVMITVAGVTLSEGAFKTFLSTTDRQKARAILTGMNVAVTATTAILLVPHFGLGGALAAHAISRILCLGLSWTWVSTVGGFRVPWAQLVRLILAAGTAGLPAWGTVWMIGGLAGHLLAVVVYVGLLFMGSVFFRCWTQTDLEVIAAVSQRRLPDTWGISHRIAQWGERFGAR